MNKNFYIFLDIDGVMNNATYFGECLKRHNIKGIMSFNRFPFDPKCLNNLMILNQKLTNVGYKVHIILSSTWRMNSIDSEIVQSRLAEYGMKFEMKTPFNGDRTKEIMEFVANYRCVNYLVLDDANCDFLPEHFIHTSFRTGFDDKKLQESLDKVGIK